MGYGVADSDGLRLRSARTVRSGTRQGQHLSLLCSYYGVHRGSFDGRFPGRIYPERTTGTRPAGRERANFDWLDADRSGVVDLFAGQAVHLIRQDPEQLINLQDTQILTIHAGAHHRVISMG